MGTQSTSVQTTNPFGRCFVSYRRTASKEVSEVTKALQCCGVPTFRDVDNLFSGPTGDPLIAALESPETSSALWWLTPDVEESLPILNLEAPRIQRRTRQSDCFFSETCIAEGLDYGEVDAVLEKVAMIERIGSGWNLRKCSDPLAVEEVRDIAQTVLQRRMEAICSCLSPDEPLRMKISTRPDSPLDYDPEIALQVDWSGCFANSRLATLDTWRHLLLPSLSIIASAMQRAAPKRMLIADGMCCLPAAFAIGRMFMEPTRLGLTWRQFTGGTETDWSLRIQPEDSGFTAEEHHIAFDSPDLAIMINVSSSNVEAAVQASRNVPSKFGVAIRVSRPGATGPQFLDMPGEATYLARLIANAIKSARDKHPHLETTHLFMSGPAGLAVMIGQQLNGIGPVQTYEHLQDKGPGQYAPAVLLTDTLTENYLES